MAGRDLELSSGPSTRPGVRRAPLVSRAASLGQAPVLLCAVGPHRLAFDLRSLRHIDVDAPLPLLPGPEGVMPASQLDLRLLLGADAGAAAQALLYSTPEDPTLRRLLVDAGSLRLRRVELARVHPLPQLLRRHAPLAAVRGVVDVEDDQVAWLVDPARLDAQPREAA